MKSFIGIKFRFKMKYKLIPVLILILYVACSFGQEKQSLTYKDIPFTELFKRSEGWIAGDGGYSIPIGNNKSLWTFGDSYMDCYDAATKTVPCLFQARNSAIIIDVIDPTDQMTLINNKGVPTFFVAGTDRKYWFWPLSGFMHHDTIYVFQSRIMATGEPGMWGFAGVDTNYVAKIHTSAPSEIQYSVLPSRNSINFGISVIKDGRFTLVYGIKSNGFGNDVFVARFRTGDIYYPWQYFDGKGWTADLNKIKKIHSEFTASFYICKIKDRYILITTEFSVGCDQGKNIFSATSDKPWGPFTGQHSIWQVDDTINGHYPFFYMANAHPEFDNGKKELLITYCINGYGNCVETCVDGRMDPNVYRPKAIRIPYKNIFP
jgi:hypothetical protein